MARWDWYETTIHGAQVDEITGHLLANLDLATLVPDRPRHGYLKGAALSRGSHVLARVWWDGNAGVHVIASGADSPVIAELLTTWEHHPTRVDACEDWIEEGLFNRLSAKLIEYAKQHGITISHEGDWSRGKARTLYLGSKTSTVRLVLYEKGYQANGDPNWVRLEVRVRPKNNRHQVATWVPGHAFGASRWVRGALTTIGWDHLQASSVGTIRTPSDLERAWAVMLKQYGRTIRSKVDELGSWEALTTELRVALEATEA